MWRLFENNKTIFVKIWAKPGLLFVYSRPFHNNCNYKYLNLKSGNGVRTWGRRMVGTDESTILTLLRTRNSFWSFNINYFLLQTTLWPYWAIITRSWCQIFTYKCGKLFDFQKHYVLTKNCCGNFLKNWAIFIPNSCHTAGRVFKTLFSITI